VIDSKVKISIVLPDDVQEDYSIYSESLWFIKEGEYYRLINIPLFLEDLSVEDVVSLVKVHDDFYRILEYVEESGNSTIWARFSDVNNAKSVTDIIHKLGCGIEGGALKGYYAINIPSEVDIKKVFEILDIERTFGRAVIFNASDRH
jgi:hypothetical protein